MLDVPATPDSVSGLRPFGGSDPGIFREDRDDRVVLYAPGYVAVAGPETAERLVALLQSEAEPAVHGRLSEVVSTLRARARMADDSESLLRHGPFVPVSLNLYLHNACGLRCSYCYASAAPNRSGRLELDAIREAAELVAASCRAQGRDLTVVLHGGGEPTLDLDFAEQALSLVEEIAEARGVAIFRYIATNGVVSPQTARWLAQRVDLVGISCDGPPDIQDRQRPTWGGAPSSPIVERTAAALRAEGQRVQVRATVTEQTAERLVEIVTYLCETFDPEEIHLEPVYAGGRSVEGDGQRPERAAAFVEQFMAARRRAGELGVPLVYAGSRIGELHGPFCNVFRQTVNLVPGSSATACFKLTETSEVEAAGLAVGRFGSGARSGLPVSAGATVLPMVEITPAGRSMAPTAIGLDERRIRDLRAGFGRPSRCQDCFNRFHCAGDCPDQCPLLVPDGSDGPAAGGFRCQVQRRLSAAIIDEAAAGLWRALLREEAAGLVHTERVYGSAVH